MILTLKIIIIIALLIYLIARYIVRNKPKITIIEGVGKGQTRIITGFDKDTKTMKVNRPFNPLPDHTSKYQTWR